MSYTAIVCSIKTRPHPGADRLQLGTCCGHQVVVGLETLDSALGVFFPSDGQLSLEYCEGNNLFPVYDENGVRTGGGFFDPRNRRVRAQSFRGEKSDGYWAPLETLKNVNLGSPALSSAVDTLKEGDQFADLAGFEICKKYFSERTLQGMAKASRVGKKQHSQFAQHVETRQFRYEVDRIPVGAVITITEKLHGTSGRYGKVLEEIATPMGWFKRKLFRFTCWILGHLGFAPQMIRYVNLMGSRRVEMMPGVGDGYYGDADFRKDIFDQLNGNLRNGEVVYGEIVGWVNSGKAIMVQHDALKVSKEFGKRYGKFYYKYGQPDGTSKFYVYRITMVSSDGTVIELSDSQMRARAHELGFEACPLLKKFVLGPFPEVMREVVEARVSGPSTLDPSHPREGVVVRVEHRDDTYFLKEKSHDFKVMEGIAKDNTDVVDLEEVS